MLGWGVDCVSLSLVAQTTLGITSQFLWAGSPDEAWLWVPGSGSLTGVAQGAGAAAVQGSAGQGPLPGEVSVVGRIQLLAVVGLRAFVLDMLARAHRHLLPHSPLRGSAPASTGFIRVS